MYEYFYFACIKKVDSGKLYAFTLRTSDCNNLVSEFTGLMAANACKTKKQADALVDSWNNSFKANGTYLF